MPERNIPLSTDVPISFVRYCQILKISKRGSLSQLAKFCGISLAYLTRLSNQECSLPVDVAIKTVIYSQGKLDLAELCPYLQDYLPTLARLQIRKEISQNNGTALSKDLIFGENTDKLTQNEYKQLSRLVESLHEI